jgi:hypothetical protein
MPDRLRLQPGSSITRIPGSVFSRAQVRTQVAARANRLIKPARRRAGFAFIPVFKIDVPKRIGRAVREWQWRSGSCRRLGLSRSFQGPMSRPRVTFSIDIDHTEIMFRMLGVIFRCDTISSRLGVAGQRQIFFKQLIGIASNPHLSPIAAEGSVC